MDAIFRQRETDIGQTASFYGDRVHTRRLVCMRKSFGVALIISITPEDKGQRVRCGDQKILI